MSGAGIGAWEWELARAGGVGAALLVSLALAEALHRRGVRPECTRKVAHLGTGLVAAGFPWIFARVETVAVLGGAFALLLILLRRTGGLGAIHGVERRSVGDYCFAAAVPLLFLLAHADPALYVAALLTLAIADTAGAVHGSSGGRLTYTPAASSRTVEGSLAFAVAAWACMALPVWLLGRAEAGAAAAAALLAAVVVTWVEGLCPWGTDNLAVPLATYLLLARHLAQPPGQLGVELVVAALLLVVLGLAAYRWRRVSPGTLGGLLLAGMAGWAVSGAAGTALALAPAALLFLLEAPLRARLNLRAPFEAPLLRLWRRSPGRRLP
jgi:phytol kinase